MTTQAGKVALVTGASSGIGRETAIRLLQGGYTVHAGARRVDAMQDLAQQGAHVHHLDLTRGESIAATVAAILQQSGRIDLLVNNAGYGAYGAVEDLPIQVARNQMEVNLFGLAALIQAILPTMRQQRAGRIINVTSIGGKVWSLLGGWYQASKFAVEGFSDALRNELRPFGIQVVIVEPGAIQTEWSGIAIEHMQQTSGTGPYRALVTAAARVYSQEQGAAHPRLVAAAIWRGATDRRPKARYITPFIAQVIVWVRWFLPDRLFDWAWGRVFQIPQQLGSPLAATTPPDRATERPRS